MNNKAYPKEQTMNPKYGTNLIQPLKDAISAVQQQIDQLSDDRILATNNQRKHSLGVDLFIAHQIQAELWRLLFQVDPSLGNCIDMADISDRQASKVRFEIISYK